MNYQSFLGIFLINTLFWISSLSRFTSLSSIERVILLSSSSWFYAASANCAAQSELLVRFLDLTVCFMSIILFLSLPRLGSLLLMYSSLLLILPPIVMHIKSSLLVHCLDLPVCPLLRTIFLSRTRLGSMLLFCVCLLILPNDFAALSEILGLSFGQYPILH